MEFDTPLISVVLPVYNRDKYLRQAIESVLNQSYPNWELIISDDGSAKSTIELIEQYASHPKVRIHYNSQNLGLFKNLNQAIKISQGKYITILCSDDYFLPDCLAVNLKLIQNHPEVWLLLSSFKFTDENDHTIPTPNYPDCAKLPRVWEPRDSIPLLLEYGSINGNISGMFFPRETFFNIKEFRENWSHAADWEWIYRIAKVYPIFMSRENVVVIRCHSEQLSGVNFRNISNSLEVIEMVNILLQDPQLKSSHKSKYWALNIMQYHLWFAFRFCFQGRYKDALKIIKAINQVTGFNQTLFAAIKWLPNRWQVYTKNKTFPHL